MSKSIILIGPPGAGKSTIGKQLARSLSCSFTDTDDIIEAILFSFISITKLNSIDKYLPIIFELLNYLDLFNIYTSTIQNNRFYNKQICENVLPTMTRNHGCTVHVVGMIFVRIGVMRLVDDRNYEII
jgi:cytidylate kinase